MKRFITIAILAALGCTACGSSNSPAKIVQPGSFVAKRSLDPKCRDHLTMYLNRHSR